jgi:hypothetical protein
MLAIVAVSIGLPLLVTEPDGVKVEGAGGAVRAVGAFEEHATKPTTRPADSSFRMFPSRGSGRSVIEFSSSRHGIPCNKGRVSGLRQRDLCRI